MKFNLENYKPINYNKWILGEQARQGINIKRLEILTPNELKVWNIAQKYQDARNDPGHGEITAYFAIKLLNYLPGEREIVVPAAICHDCGWYGDYPEAWKRLVEANKDNLQALEGEASRRPHQNRGCLNTGIIFEKAGYPLEKYHNPIADIIGDHDTRKLPTTSEGEIVRSADFLWRVTHPLNQIYIPNEDALETIQRAEESCLYEPKTPLGDIATQIAKIELANSIYHKFPTQAEQTLKPNYSKELEIIKKLYTK